LWNCGSTAGKRLKIRSVIVFGLVSIFVSLAWNFHEEGINPTNASVSLIVSAVLTTLYALTYNHLGLSRMRRYVRTLYGREPFACAAEIRDSGLWFSEKHLQGEWNWKALKEIRESTRGVELWFDAGIVLVPKRALPTEEERNRFVERARELSASF
jgi:hypothetical protein